MTVLAAGMAAAGALRRRPSRSSSLVATILDALRRLHSGQATDYVAWLLVGAFAFVALFALQLV